MKKLLWLVGGAVIGAFAAHAYSRTESGKIFFEELDRKTDEFSSAVQESYKARESELLAAAQKVESAIKDLRS